MKKRTLTASGFRLILSCSLFVVALLGTAIFWLTNDYLRDFAITVNHINVDASASQSNLQTLQKIQQELAEEKDVVERASSIVAESKSYQYQDQIIRDLNDYAAKSGISITNLDFSSTATAPTPSKPAASAAVINGVKSVSVNVSLKNPINYDNLLRFIQSIEQNLTKMQISKISLSKDATSNEVASEAFTLEVYVR